MFTFCLCPKTEDVFKDGGLINLAETILQQPKTQAMAWGTAGCIYLHPK